MYINAVPECSSVARNSCCQKVKQSAMRKLSKKKKEQRKQIPKAYLSPSNCTQTTGPISTKLDMVHRKNFDSNLVCFIIITALFKDLNGILFGWEARRQETTGKT
jgi:hypothetical protein